MEYIICGILLFCIWFFWIGLFKIPILISELTYHTNNFSILKKGLIFIVVFSGLLILCYLIIYFYIILFLIYLILKFSMYYWRRDEQKRKIFMGIQLLFYYISLGYSFDLMGHYLNLLINSI